MGHVRADGTVIVVVSSPSGRGVGESKRLAIREQQRLVSQEAKGRLDHLPARCSSPAMPRLNDSGDAASQTPGLLWQRHKALGVEARWLARRVVKGGEGEHREGSTACGLG